ncbi:hypothetical protein [Actinomadura sp. 3N407]|uniref:hypothetical protein n=1 Tax=Actinomadura sp. 3N407 TaxID=3457423 RepID=UPI003FCDF090
MSSISHGQPDFDPCAVIADIEELIATLPADCAPIAVYSYLARQLRLGRRPTNPVKLVALLTRDTRRLHSAIGGWDGDPTRLLPALSRATEALAESIGVTADLVIEHAADPAASDSWEQLADNTAGAYDAAVAASGLLALRPRCAA